MCGIVGIMLDSGASDYRLSRARHYFRELMLCAQVRGTDAAGVMVVQPDGVDVLKSPGPARDLVYSHEFGDLMATVRRDTIAIVGHTRAASQGDPSDNANNHPLTDGDIKLVHNGFIRNWHYLEECYGSRAEVDSAALAAAVDRHSADDGLTAESLTLACEEAEGGIATVVVDRFGSPPRVYAYRNTNPLVGNTGRSGYWFGSTGDILRSAGVVGARTRCAIVPSYRGVRLMPNGPEM